MKKSLSLLLCVAMLLSIFSVTSVAADAFDASAFFAVEKTAQTDDTITYTVSLKAGNAFSGAVISAEYDTAVLKPVGAEKCTFIGPDGEEYDYMSGEFVDGKYVDADNRYNIGYAHTSNTSASKSDRPFYNITFKVIDENRPSTKVTFYISGLIGKGEASDNEDLVAHDEEIKITTVSSKTLAPAVLLKTEVLEGAIKLSWKKVTGADSYRIYRKVGSGSYEKLGEDVDASVTSVVDETVENNTAYTYTVRAINESGGADYDTAGLKFRYFDSPANITVANDVDSVKVSWSKVEGATYYRVYKRVIKVDGSKGGWMTVSSKETGLSCVDEESLKSNNAYEYTVRAYGNGGNSAHYVYKTLLYVGTPAATVKSTKSGVKITWETVAGADKYRIYRKVSGGSYEKVTDVSGDKTSYVDSKAPNNKKLYYKVKAYIDGQASACKSAGVNYLKAPDASVKNTSSGVKISWSKISGATKYVVYRKAGGASSWSKVATVKTNYYTDKDVKSGKKYTYTVKAYNGSFYSSYDSKGDGIYFVTSPKLSGATSSKSGITVKWNKISGASGYLVYRKTGSGSYERITKITSSSKVSYVDKSAAKGKTYTYRVYAYKSSSKSAASNAVSCKDKY